MDENNVQIVMKLFDQVKSSCDKTDKNIEDLSSVVRSLLDSSSSPSHQEIEDLIRELQSALDTHDKQILTVNPSGNIKEIKDKLSSIHKDLEEHDDSIVTSRTKIKDSKILLTEIKDKVEKVSKKVTNMIYVVVIAASLVGGAYFIVSHSIETIIKAEMVEFNEDQNKLLDKPDQIKALIYNLSKKLDDHMEKE
jgi:uncharacterized coiled-coil DUF342 family protein